MRDVFIKLRMKCLIIGLRFKNSISKITKPFQIFIELIKRYWTLRKIHKESNNGWEEHLKLRELERKDELAQRKNQFRLLKIQFIGVFFRTAICSELPEQLNEVDDYPQKFQENKEELISLLEKLCDYDEINFDAEIKSAIISWDFGKFKTKEQLANWMKIFSDYICTLDID